jgi:alkylation response protein AidB-like acyl-CoA dehydrogenase
MTFRSEFRAFLEVNHPGPPPRGSAERLAFRRRWAAFLADQGYAAPSWPREWGGMALSLHEQLAYHEESTRAGVPTHPEPNNFIIGPTLIRHGTDEQRQRFLRPLLRADELWCQGWSEPGAGSDLAALTTRAERVDDRYVVNGQKLWTTHADVADWMFALVRTGPVEAGSKAITYLLIPMDAAGVVVRPLRDLTGRCDFSEVFFEDVEVSCALRVGPENEGWPIVRTSIGHERATAFIATEIRYRRIVQELVAMAQELGLAQDHVIRQDLARCETEVRLLAWNGARVLERVLEGEEPGPASSISRLFSSSFERRLHEVAMQLQGAHGMLSSRDPDAVERGRWTYGFLATRASTIGAGTAEIQRNTIAEKVLGLPKEGIS